jgi:hypothetical protein
LLEEADGGYAFGAGRYAGGGAGFVDTAYCEDWDVECLGDFGEAGQALGWAGLLGGGEDWAEEYVVGAILLGGAGFGCRVAGGADQELGMVVPGAPADYFGYREGLGGEVHAGSAGGYGYVEAVVNDYFGAAAGEFY